MNDPAEYADDHHSYWLRESYDSDLRERANDELNTIAAQQQEN